MTTAHRVRGRGLRRAMIIVVPLALLAALAIALLPARSLAPPVLAAEGATVAYTHEKHIAAGVNCLFCHPQALNGPVATIPSVQKCAGCHQNIDVTSQAGQETIDQLLLIWQEGRPLRWPKVVDLPDFVAFNHRPHIAAGFNCERCHGDVGSMTVAHLAFDINMGFCLQNCHKHQDELKRERLMDCATCHQ